MKASLITPTGEADSTFVTTNDIYRPSSLVMTVAQFIIAVARRFEAAIQAVIIDRPIGEPNANGRVMFFPASVDVSGTLWGSTTGPNPEDRVAAVAAFGLSADKTGQGSYLSWGIGEISPTDIEAAVTAAIADLEIDAESGIENESLNDAIMALVAPVYGAIAPRSGLEKVIDLMEHFRGETIAPILHLMQSENSVTVEFLSANAAGRTATIASVVDAEPFLDVAMKMPEAPAVTSTTPKLALE